MGLRRIKKKSKKGDVPVTVLVIGVFVVCTLAIISFIHHNITINNSFVGIDIMEKASIEIEKSASQTYHDDKKTSVFRPKLGLDWFEEKVVFSVDYTKVP